MTFLFMLYNNDEYFHVMILYDCIPVQKRWLAKFYNMLFLLHMYLFSKYYDMFDNSILGFILCGYFIQ